MSCVSGKKNQIYNYGGEDGILENSNFEKCL